MTEPSGPTPEPDAERLSAVADAFVELADWSDGTGLERTGPEQTDRLEQLVVACVDLVGVTGVAVMLRAPDGGLAVAATSSDAVRALEELQVRQGRGPCVDCVRTGQRVHQPDLSGDQRWPQFAAAALQAGFRSVAGLPLWVGGEVVGGLNLFSDATAILSEADQRVAQALGEVAAIAMAHRRASEEHRHRVAQLQHALNSRVVIEQAKGILAERHGVGTEEAFRLLRRHARDHNLKMSEAAQSVLRRDARIAAPERFDRGADQR